MSADFFTELRAALRAASEQAFTRVRDSHPASTFYAFALNTQLENDSARQLNPPPVYERFLTR